MEKLILLTKVGSWLDGKSLAQGISSPAPWVNYSDHNRTLEKMPRS
jgi:hypothetical protein